jgi:hypothetical protein
MAEYRGLAQQCILFNPPNMDTDYDNRQRIFSIFQAQLRQIKSSYAFALAQSYINVAILKHQSTEESEAQDYMELNLAQIRKMEAQLGKLEEIQLVF